MYYLGNLYIGTKSKCLFDGKQIIDKYNWIPKECNPVSIISTRFSVAGQLVLRTETSHSYNENDIVQIVLQINTGNQKSTIHHANIFPEAIISYSVLVLNSVELKLLNLIAGEVERNLTMLLHASSIYVRSIHCENALFKKYCKRFWLHCGSSFIQRPPSLSIGNEFRRKPGKQAEKFDTFPKVEQIPF